MRAALTRVAAAAVTVAFSVGCSDAGGDVELGPPTGFQVSVDEVDRPVSGHDGMAMREWQTAWELTWVPVEGAESYVVRYATNEGTAGSGSRRSVSEPLLRVEVSAGTSTVDRLEQDRAAGQLFTSSQLLVSVAATTGDGASGAASPWFPVGDVPADGRPLGTTGPGG